MSFSMFGSRFDCHLNYRRWYKIDHAHFRRIVEKYKLFSPDFAWEMGTRLQKNQVTLNFDCVSIYTCSRVVISKIYVY